jgi:predicted metalloprotease with PDZ domain
MVMHEPLQIYYQAITLLPNKTATSSTPDREEFEMAALFQYREKYETQLSAMQNIEDSLHLSKLSCYVVE